MAQGFQINVLFNLDAFGEVDRRYVTEQVGLRLDVRSVIKNALGQAFADEAVMIKCEHVTFPG